MNISQHQFGLLAAYLLPGFVGLAGIAPFAPIVALWLKPLNQSELSIAPPIYAILAATTIGLTLNCARWLTIDHIHYWTGVTPPVWDDTHLEERLAGFEYLVQNHLRYAQFVGNTLIAVIVTYLINRCMRTSPIWGLSTDLGFLFLCITLFAGSRDALLKYYTRTSRLVGQVAEKGSTGQAMYMHNGNDHKSEPVESPAARPNARRGHKPQPTRGQVKPKPPQSPK